MQNSGNGNECELFCLVQKVSKEYSKLSPSPQAALAKGGHESNEEKVPTNIKCDTRDDDDDDDQWRKPCVMMGKLMPKEVKWCT
jgi:hypothetical protein